MWSGWDLNLQPWIFSQMHTKGNDSALRAFGTQNMKTSLQKNLLTE